MIFDAVRTIDDVLHYTKEFNINGLLVTIDFEKAFDSINWNYLIRTYFRRILPLLSNGLNCFTKIYRAVW